jgi:hypothetical protein
MKKILLLSAIVMLLGLSADTFAQNRRYSSRSRIRSGVRSGQLTRAEARVLREQQRQIRQQRRVYRSDGTLTRAERRDLRHDRRDLGRQIRRERHDNDNQRGDGYYRRGAGSPTHPVFGTGGNRGRGRGRN